MTKIKFAFYLLFISVIFISCDPATALYITNESDYDVYIEYEFGNIEIQDYYKVYNNFEIKAGENHPVISIFPGTSIMEQLGYVPINSLEDIVEAIDSIFISIDIYRINNNEKVKIYDKSYFLNQNNMRRHRYPVSYSIEYIIR